MFISLFIMANFFISDSMSTKKYYLIDDQLCILKWISR